VGRRVVHVGRQEGGGRPVGHRAASARRRLAPLRRRGACCCCRHQAQGLPALGALGQGRRRCRRCRSSCGALGGHASILLWFRTHAAHIAAIIQQQRIKCVILSVATCPGAARVLAVPSSVVCVQAAEGLIAHDHTTCRQAGSSRAAAKRGQVGRPAYTRACMLATHQCRLASEPARQAGSQAGQQGISQQAPTHRASPS
jgi:hypothetical protein